MRPDYPNKMVSIMIDHKKETAHQVFCVRSELQNHKQSLQDLVDILTDTSSGNLDTQQPKAAHQTQRTQTISSISNSELSPDDDTKLGGKRKHSEISKTIRTTEASPVPQVPRHEIFSAADDRYMWDTYQQSLQSGDKIPKDKKSPHGMCGGIAQKLGRNRQSIANRLEQLRTKHAQEEVCTRGYWTESDVSSASSGEESPNAKAPVLFTRKSSFTRADDVQIWNAYIRDGCEVKTALAYTWLAKKLCTHEVLTIHHRLINLVAADQGVSKREIKLCLFKSQEDEQILAAHRNNLQRTPSSQLSEKDWSTTLGKVLHREPARVLYRARKLLSERAVANSRLQWEQRARRTPRATMQKGKSRPYSAEAENLLAEVEQSVPDVNEKFAVLKEVAKGLDRTYDALKGHLCKLRKDRHASSTTNALVPSKDVNILPSSTAEGVSSGSDGSSSSDVSTEIPKRHKIGTGFTYSRTDNSAILEAYMSSEAEQERTAALKLVATRLGRSYLAVLLHAKRLLEKQSNLHCGSDYSEGNDSSNDNSLEGFPHS